MTEHDEQVALLKFCNLNQVKYPELALLYAIPNGGNRNIVTATKLKAEGVKAGVPDLCLPVPRGGYHGMYLEMKKIAAGLARYSNGGYLSLRLWDFIVEWATAGMMVGG